MELVQNEYYGGPYASSGRPIEVNAIERVGVNLKFGGDKPYVIGLYLHNNDYFHNQFSPISGPAHATSVGLVHWATSGLNLYRPRDPNGDIGKKLSGIFKALLPG